MQHIYTWLRKPLLVIGLLFTLQFSVKAQLNAGDIVFTGYLGGLTNSTEQFSFVVLVNVASGTQINFTDNGWNGTSLNATEQTVTFTAGALIPAGREIKISGPSGAAGATAIFAGNGSSAGTCSGSMPSFTTSGDQVLAYRGTAASPIFLAGLHMNQYNAPTDPCGTTTQASWDPSGCGPNGSHSIIPPGLTAGTNALWIGDAATPNTDVDNAVFNCTGPLTTAAQVRAAVCNPNNWTPQNGNPTITVPSNCAFLGLAPLPIKLESFTGKLNSDKTVILQWKVAEQQDVQNYVLEESTDGTNFTTLTAVSPQATETSYSYTDLQVNSGKNYYRLKTTEFSGKITYSNIIAINLKAGIVISVYPNPVKDKLTIQQFGTAQNKTATLSDGQGKVLISIKLTSLQQTINMERYATGIYVLKLDDGTTYKIVKE